MNTLIKKLLLACLSAFFFTGCINYNIDYDPQKVTSKIKPNLSKVEIEKVTVISNPNDKYKKIKKHLKGRTYGATIDMAVGEINEKVSKLFFEQYFDIVQIGETVDRDSLFSIDSEILDYEWDRSFPDIIHIDLDLQVNIYRKEKLVISKIYKLRDYDSSVLLVLANFTLVPLIQETFHKGVLHLYETKVKPDLLNELNGNI